MAKLRPNHGGIHHSEFSEFSLDASGITDFSVNVNPYGPCPTVLDAIRRADLQRYCDPTGADTREALARHLGCSQERVCLGNGAAELMWSLARALSRRAGPFLIATPTFSEFGAALRACGAAVLEVQATEAQGFVHDLRAIRASLSETRAQALYLCTPNNPTGAPMPIEAICDLASAHPKTLFAIDQAFLSLSERHADAQVLPPPNVILLRSLTKDHSIPGLRVGYMVGPAEVLAQVEAERPPWTTSAPAQAAILASLEADAFVAESRRRMQEDRDALAERLRGIGLAPLPSDAPYLLVKTPDATALRERLVRKHGVLVRDCSSFGLPMYTRLAARPAEDVERLIRALTQELA